MLNSKRYIYAKRLSDGRVLDLNYWEWEIIIRRQKSSGKIEFEFVEEINLDEAPKMDKNIKGVPIEDDPLECPICGFVAASVGRLALHKKDIHL